MIVFLMGFGTRMAWLRSVSICFTDFGVLSPNERDGTFGFESSKKELMSVIDWRK